MNIKPFKAIRPTAETAAGVACVPYDTVNTREARELAEGNPDSFMHVIRPDIDLPDNISPSSDEAYSTALASLRRLRDNASLIRETSQCFYLYSQKMAQHEQTGLVACCHIDDYAKTILIHEKTRRDKEEDRTRHLLTLKANTGPVFLTYRDNGEINAIVSGIRSEDPLINIESPDGVRHTVWRIEETAPVQKAFRQVPRLYVADGHHRSAAAVRAGREMQSSNPNHTGDEEYNWFLTVIFPASQLKIMPYNRIVHDLNGLTEENFLLKAGTIFTVTETETDAPGRPCSVNMYLNRKWYRLSWENSVREDPAEMLDVSVLQERLLKPLLNIDDPRTDNRIRFVGGIRGTSELVRLVDNSDAAVAFSMFPVQVEEMMAIADNGGIMPPKSTWFEPKLRSGLFVHSIG